MKNKNLKGELSSIYGKVGKFDVNSSYPSVKVISYVDTDTASKNSKNKFIYLGSPMRENSKNKFIYLGSPMRCLVVKLNEPNEDIPNTVFIKEDYFYAEDETMERFDYVRYLVKAVNNHEEMRWTMDSKEMLNYLKRAVEIIENTLGEDLVNHKDMLQFKDTVLRMEMLQLKTDLSRKGKRV